ncbi:hypothetical protein DOTSEDRAFT_72186 [Dothistroma septosporum NZE10]|uniref:Uncharacterized protein n=1 Tax=Dothistroma septosporum (strain NZE10 / CBS 128990) TaxID=675120 RepID=N1PQF1_DOTSN|nr:hypothetical protein DOTSEDRAFT_72186 [Dothistroma septosporum NZE10]
MLSEEDTPLPSDDEDDRDSVSSANRPGRSSILCERSHIFAAIATNADQWDTYVRANRSGGESFPMGCLQWI